MDTRLEVHPSSFFATLNERAATFCAINRPQVRPQGWYIKPGREGVELIESVSHTRTKERTRQDIGRTAREPHGQIKR